MSIFNKWAVGNFNNTFDCLQLHWVPPLPQMTVMCTSNRAAIISFFGYPETHDHPEGQGVVLSDKHVAWPKGITSLEQKFLSDPH